VEDEDSISDLEFSTSTGYDEMTQTVVSVHGIRSVWGLELWSRAVEQDKMTYLMEAVLEIVIGLQIASSFTGRIVMLYVPFIS